MTPHFKDKRFYFIYIKNSDASISHIFLIVSRKKKIFYEFMLTSAKIG